LAGIPQIGQLQQEIMEVRTFVDKLARGDLSMTISAKGFVCGSLKAVEANLKHLNWQAQMIAQGDFSQRVDFLGEFSEAFNFMVVSLEQSEGILKEKISQLEQALLLIKKAEEQIRASLQEKEVLLKEIHHRVKNNMQIISTLLTLQGKFGRGRTPEELFRDCRTRIRSMSLIHEYLYGTKNLSNLDFLEYLQKLTRSVAESHGAMELGIRVKVTGDHLILDIDKSVTCGLITNELLLNCLKHAFPGERGGEIQVHLEKQENNQTLLEVKDNGVGLDPNFSVEKSTSLGLTLIHNLVKQLRGSLAMHSNGGTTFRIVFEDGVRA